MFDIENINIRKCIDSECQYCMQTMVKSINAYNKLNYCEVWYCKLETNERYYECPLFRADVDRITDIIRFEVKQVSIINNKHIKVVGWHIFDNDYGHLIDLIDTFDYEDKDKADKLCEWLNKVNGRSKHLEEMSENK